ncbi:uncharacterized protein [Oscarella lobularis]|uniref:uncharacterized protein n=1 Tax=Oscarella lobularis TaxID=121494 RepID=UPI0033133F64
MATMLGCSERTVHRRLREAGLSVSRSFTDISDEELEEAVADVNRHFSRHGYRLVTAHLHSRGIRVPRRRVRECLSLVDPEGVALRWGNTIHRRTYNVAGPNALWHVDGLHALIRWGLVIHGGIDGYSRMPVYLQCSANNRSTTVMQCFQRAIGEFGIPSRVRGDRGRENIAVAEWMIATLGAGRGSYIAGRSVHNQRIERFWRDVTVASAGTFREIFYYLESENLLDPDSPADLFCLHYVFIPRIQESLDCFRSAWAHHRMSTERGRTPMQLFVSGVLGGLLPHFHHSYDASDGDAIDIDHYGIDWNGPIPEDVGDSVPVEDLPEIISDEALERLRVTIDPLRDDEEYGIALYRSVADFVDEHM